MSGSTSRPGSRPSSAQSQATGLQVHLRDVQDLLRGHIVGLPGGFTKSGHPLLYLPDNTRFNSVLESDLHLLLKYFLSVVPRAEQNTGFAIVIDRRNVDWSQIQGVFSKVITLFPAKIKEVFLLYQYPQGKPVIGQLVDDYLLDFDIFHVEHVTELVHYIDAKYLPTELGGSNMPDVDSWIFVQKHVEAFTHSATKIARRLAHFVKILNQEDISQAQNHDTIQEVAQKNRTCYRRLRKELEDITEHGVNMLGNFQEYGANIMQRLAVQILCTQLENTWQYFTTTFKMQDHLYVQYVELNQFQNEFRELSHKFQENEKIIKKLGMSGCSIEEVNTQLDKLDSVIEALSVDVIKAKNLAKQGQELIMEHSFATDCLQPKCSELKILCKRQEILFLERRRALLKFLELFEGVETAAKWCDTALMHLDREQDMVQGDHILSIRQLDYILSKSTDLKIKSRLDFEDDFDDIKDFISAKIMFTVDDEIKRLDEIKGLVIERRDALRERCSSSNGKPSIQNADDLSVRRENIITELIDTEERYVDDLRAVLTGYRDKMYSANSSLRLKAETIFGNLDEIYKFHSESLLPELERCGANTQQLARTFMELSDQLRNLYCRYCQNMESARTAVAEVGENNPLIINCQQELGHQLPLSSYLLKPVQRLTKYQLLLKDLSESSSNVLCGRFELEESLESMLSVIKLVNDSLHQINIRGLPEVLHPLGSLVCQESFLVLTENKSQSQILFRNKQQKRHVLLYDNYLIFCKQINERSSGTYYQFKFSLGASNLGMSSILKSDEKKMEIWITGQSDLYILENKTKQGKEDFAAELRKVIVKNKEKVNIDLNGKSQGAVFNDNQSTTSGSESLRSRRSQMIRSRSLERSLEERRRRTHRSQSLDPYQDRSSSEAELIEQAPQYQVLADYTALTGRELNLHEGDFVDLIKIGCSGWWYIRLQAYPCTEGWAPSTYLEKLNRNRSS